MCYFWHTLGGNEYQGMKKVDGPKVDGPGEVFDLSESVVDMESITLH